MEIFKKFSKLRFVTRSTLYRRTRNKKLTFLSNCRVNSLELCLWIGADWYLLCAGSPPLDVALWALLDILLSCGFCGDWYVTFVWVTWFWCTGFCGGGTGFWVGFSAGISFSIIVLLLSFVKVSLGSIFLQSPEAFSFSRRFRSSFCKFRFSLKIT